MKTTKEMVEIMNAFDNGEEIEILVKDSHHWTTVTNPIWNWANCDYRIKPKAPTRLEVANQFWEKTFGIKNEFNEYSCIHRETGLPCCACTAYKNGECLVEKWWNAPVEEKGGTENDT